MEPMTQSAQISSSQGFADGQNSAAKESKLSDSFLSSSPVSLIQSPQDKRVVAGSDKPSEGVATSLRFPSQPGSFSPNNYGSEAEQVDEQPDSPIKTSPVSERIKALEALAAKKREPDFRGDGSYIHFRDRHHERSIPEIPRSLPDVPKSLPDVPRSLPDVPRSLPDVPRSLPDAPRSLPEAPRSLPQVTKSLPEAPKSLPETNVPTSKKVIGPSSKESPESPFEVLGDVRQVSEFEETEEWMKAHLPPVPDFDAVGLNKCGNNVPLKEADMDVPDSPAAFAGVPDAFMDSPVDAPKLKDDDFDEQKQAGAEEFDISFLPTAYVWDQQEKSGVQAPLNLDSVISSSPAPPAGFGPSPPSSPASSDVKQSVSREKKASWAGDPEAGEADSSGDSDDTVIEDGVGAPVSVPPPSFDPPVSNDPSTVPDLPSEKETPPPKSERKLMQVPTINVIETDEPNYSDEEMEMEPEAEEDEDYEVVKDPARELEPEVIKTDPPKKRPLETEFMEGYSPPSSPVDSDAEYSPKHKIFQTVSETGHQQSQFKSEDLPDPGVSKDTTYEFSQPQSDKPQVNQVGDQPSPALTGNEEVDFPDNDDEWSDEVQDILVKPRETDLPSKESAPYNPSKVDDKSNKAAKDAFKETAPISITGFMQDEIYDRQSFDYDYDITLDHSSCKGLNNAKERFLSDPGQNDAAEDGVISLNCDEAFSKTIRQQSVEDYPPNPYSCFQTETLSSINEQDFIQKATSDDGNNVEKDDVLDSQKPGSEVQRDVDAESPDGVDSSSSEPTDSFVDFMRECLKSKQDNEPENLCHVVPSNNELSKTILPSSQPSPSMVMDLEQEKLTISALKELGSSQDEEDLMNLQPKASDQNQANPSATSMQSVPHPPCSQSNRVFDATYSKEVEAIDEWVAEAYHLAEHVLTAILTHLSVKDLIHWRDPKKSGLVFGLSMLLLLSLAAFSVISVASYLLLALLCVTITFRIYKSVVQAVQKSSEGHPFKALIDKDVSIPPETFRKHVDASLTYINRALKQMSRLFLVEDLVDSLKLAVVMWLLTYVGAVFNGITLLILADILLFAVPPVYEKNKTQIDQYIDLVRTQVNTTIAKLQEKLPGAVKRSKTE
ncbi:reticulon-3 isoform X1 [Melanotaenia boesemani]|uniref:reticulon-3 isoform X1 n=1 Tax=Melanotaenia boesemani TaxID=1250792 RepID=UPI001C058222|nr:reticulon-3 isoform X1 [Melanotaenia boesemani]